LMGTDFLKNGGGGRLEETRRTARILDIIQHIAVAPSRWTRKALAEKYEVSERQIQKDFEIIRRRLNLDLQHDEDGYVLRNAPRLPIVAYSFPEALSLLLAVRAARMIPGIDAADLASAMGRLESLFPEDAVPLLKEVISRAGDRPCPKRRRELLTVLHKAIAEQRRLRITYRTASRAGAESRRVVDPYRIIPFMRVWQLIAYCHTRKEVLEFNVDRIKKAEILKDGFEIPVDFSLGSYFAGAWGVFRDKTGSPEDIVLEFDTDSGRWVEEGLWPVGRKIEHLKGGGMRMEVRVCVSPDFVSWLMYFGRKVKIISPAWLRKRVAAEHRESGRLQPPDGGALE
jgi:predicted DNA-binding transcriptional regulator YafY